jgi:hypothetical protein
MTAAERSALTAVMECIDEQASSLPASSEWRAGLLRCHALFAVALGRMPLSVVALAGGPDE